MITRRILCFCFTVICFFWGFSGRSQTSINPKTPLIYPRLVERFYTLNPNGRVWSNGSLGAGAFREAFIRLIDSSLYLGLSKERYHYNEIIRCAGGGLQDEKLKNDQVFTDGLIAFCKDIYYGADIERWIKNDEVSGKFANADDSFILNIMSEIRDPGDLVKLINLLTPKDKEYTLLDSRLKKEAKNNPVISSEMQASINLYKWIHHFKTSPFIVVNLPSATLRYYENDSIKLSMKVVAGKLSTRSPRFSTWCWQVVLYPYWNVPEDIGLRELLPHFKKNSAYGESSNMQVLNKNGKVINPHSINWSQYNRSNFPYSFRQCTGCENSLGVIKFNLTDPFDVYLHDTNFKLAFLKDTRFLSHGCIRVEKPIELANYLLDNQVDSNFLKACYKGLQPIPVNLKEKVPVFVVYMPAEVVGDSVKIYKDIYRLFTSSKR